MTYKRKQVSNIANYLSPDTFSTFCTNHTNRTFGITISQLAYIMCCDTNTVLYQYKRFCAKNKVELVKTSVSHLVGTFDCYYLEGEELLNFCDFISNSRVKKEYKDTLHGFLIEEGHRFYAD